MKVSRADPARPRQSGAPRPDDGVTATDAACAACWPQRGVPIAHSRSDAFDAMVLHAVDHLQPRLAEQLRSIEFAVEDVPAVADDKVSADDVLDDNSVPLSRLYRNGLAGISSPVIVLYRRPLESRASRAEELAGLVHDVVVEQVARMLNTTAEEIDPGPE